MSAPDIEHIQFTSQLLIEGTRDSVDEDFFVENEMILLANKQETEEYIEQRKASRKRPRHEDLGDNATPKK